jgi:hypothetical protein
MTSEYEMKNKQLSYFLLNALLSHNNNHDFIEQEFSLHILDGVVLQTLQDDLEESSTEPKFETILLFIEGFLESEFGQNIPLISEEDQKLFTKFYSICLKNEMPCNMVCPYHLDRGNDGNPCRLTQCPAYWELISHKNVKLDVYLH